MAQRRHRSRKVARNWRLRHDSSNVLKEAGIDSDKYAGFAWGFGLERMVMLKHGIEDIRHFNSGKIEFMRQFS